MSTHTPGPWAAIQRDDDCWDIYSDVHGNIATLHDPIGFELVMDNIEADARLIAAAPDLLEFIESITDALGPYKDLNGHQIVHDAYKVMRVIREVNNE